MIYCTVLAIFGLFMSLVTWKDATTSCLFLGSTIALIAIGLFS